MLGSAGLTQRVRESLPAGEPFELLAESFSGSIGIALAATPPAGLRGLILSCTCARPPRPGRGLASRRVVVASELRTLAQSSGEAVGRLKTAH